MNDSRIQQLRQELACAQAALDDARCLAADIWEQFPDLNPLDLADFRIARSSISRSLLKARNATAALARLEDRAVRADKIQHLTEAGYGWKP